MRTAQTDQPKKKTFKIPYSLEAMVEKSGQFKMNSESLSREKTGLQTRMQDLERYGEKNLLRINDVLLEKAQVHEAIIQKLKKNDKMLKTFVQRFMDYLLPNISKLLSLVSTQTDLIRFIFQLVVKQEGSPELASRMIQAYSDALDAIGPRYPMQEESALDSETRLAFTSKFRSLNAALEPSELPDMIGVNGLCEVLGQLLQSQANDKSTKQISALVAADQSLEDFLKESTERSVIIQSQIINQNKSFNIGLPDMSSLLVDDRTKSVGHEDSNTDFKYILHQDSALCTPRSLDNLHDLIQHADAQSDPKQPVMVANEHPVVPFSVI